MSDDFFEAFDDEPKIDLTPLIDCLFMLIVFFVLTMSFSRPILDIVLPQAKNAEQSARRDELVLNVRSDGSMWLGEESADAARLGAELDAQPDKLLNIFMDEKAPFASFVVVMDVAKVKRAGRFVITTRDLREAAGAEAR